jgi:hypothetical protein
MLIALEISGSFMLEKELEIQEKNDPTIQRLRQEMTWGTTDTPLQFQLKKLGAETVVDQWQINGKYW